MAHNSLTPDERMELAISDCVTRLYLDTFGKGPLHAETFVNGDVITTLLRNVYTTAEKMMAEAGKIATVRATRMEWQAITDESFRSGVGEATGRHVVAAVSGFDVQNDLATEVFVLEKE